jgi:hypothetical protein
MWVIEAAKMQFALTMFAEQGVMQADIANAYVQLVRAAENGTELALVSLCITRRAVEA